MTTKWDGGSGAPGATVEDTVIMIVLSGGGRGQDKASVIYPVTEKSVKNGSQVKAVVNGIKWDHFYVGGHSEFVN